MYYSIVEHVFTDYCKIGVKLAVMGKAGRRCKPQCPNRSGMGPVRMNLDRATGIFCDRLGKQQAVSVER